jgi:hypothetical protein
LALSACDIVQGFRNTGDAIFPTEQNYLDVPGFRMVDGGYKNLQFAAGTDLFLLARSADSSDASLYATRYADPKVCSIPNVGSYQATYGAYQGPTMIGYFEKNAETDPQCAAPCLRFADAACNLYSLHLPRTTLPMDEEASGFTVLSAGNLVFVDPPSGTMRTLVQAVQGVLWHALGDVTLVGAQNRIGAFRSNGTELGWFGSGIAGGGGAGSKFFFEDTAGIHSLSSSGGGAPTVTDTIVAQGGCRLTIPVTYGATDAWVLYDPACDGSKVTAYGVNSGHTSDLGFAVDARHLEVAPAWPATSGDPGVDPFFYLYLTNLTNPDDTSSLGTLVLRTPDHTEHVLGSAAALERATLFASQDGTRGYALIDVDGDTGTFVRFLADGTIDELAHQVLRGTTDLIVNYDGTWGDFALPTDSGVSVVAHHVPPGGFLLREQKGRWTGILHDYQDSLATLSITTSMLDFFRSAQAPVPAPSLEDLASGVLPSRTQFLTSLPGIAFMTNYDSQKRTGKLQYRNLELEFTATVSEGLSDYISTDDGIIYSVPAGDGAGVWAVRAR